MIVFVVAHTHWDREWYHGVGRFRQRLVALVDELLDRAPDARTPFLLDGQGVVLEDYLAVRPERERELAAALRDGWLEAGPWYVLADELIPSGESLVRNLLAGHALLRRLGAAPPPVLYSPDAFGHPAALPTLAAGFGLPLVMLWRGYGGPRWPAGDAARWEGPDGATVLLFHLPPDGYEFGSSLPVDDAGAARRWAGMRAVLAPRARLDLLLVQNGADHHALQRGAPAAYAALARAAAPADQVEQATLRRVAEELVRRGARTELPTVRGELRDSYGYTWTLQGTFATRAPQKRRAAAAERLLLRDVEPWVALAGGAGGPSARAALAVAWRTLLRCHPHDTLCGCSVDTVARAMDGRLASARQQGAGLRDDALAALVGHDPAAARERRSEWRPVLVVRNRAPRPRAGVAEVELLTFVADEPVGPGSGGRAPARPVAWPERVQVDDGRVLVQPLRERLRRDRVESPRHYPDNDIVRRTRALAWVPEVPPYGLLSLPLSPFVHHAPTLPPSVVRAAADSLDNGLLAAHVGADGRLSLVVGAGRRMDDVLGFEDVGDAGDTYTHSPVGEVRTGARFLGARLTAGGPLRGEIELRYALRLPARRSRRSASGRRVTVPLRVRLTLDAGAPFLRIAVHGVNRARDHRLRLLLRTGIARPVVHADAAFGPARREPPAAPPEDMAAERAPATAPLHRYVTLHDDTHGATVYSDGLAEYEATADGTVAVTLLRAVGTLSRNDLPERPGHAGWPAPTPAAQSLGPFVARLALFPHGPRTEAEVARLERTADDVLLPLRGHTLRAALHHPPPLHGVELLGEGLAFGAVKPSENGHALVLRCVNLLDRPVDGAWRLREPPAAATRARLDEAPGEPIAVRGRDVPFTAGPRDVVTVLVVIGDGGAPTTHRASPTIA